jgi:lipid-A-disaccharide synthase
MKKVFISVGEASGDMYAAELVKRLPDFNWYGITGSKLRDLNVKSIQNIENIAVVGITEVLPKYLEIRKTFKKAVEELKKDTDTLIVIDFPDFNLRLLEEAKKLNKKTIYFIPPQVWAWRKGRIKKIVEYTDLIISIFPFEKDLYQPYIKNENQFFFTGHPLLDIVKVEETEGSFRKKLNIEKNKTIFGLLPGSRDSEIKRNLPIMLETASLLIKDFPNLHFVIPVHKTRLELTKEIVKNFNLPINIITEEDFKYPSYEVMNKAYFSIITSGTATLEASIIGNPFCIVYKTSNLTYFIGKLLVSIDFIGLPNIIAGKEIVKEFIQNDFNSINLYQHIASILKNKSKYENIKEELNNVHNKLGKKGALDRISQKIREFITKE